jgi:hypothetical protein
MDRQQLAALVDDKGNREIVLGFKGEDAATVINAIDKVSRSRPFMSTTVIHTFYLSVHYQDSEGGSSFACDQVARLQANAKTCWGLASSPEKLSC